MGMKLSPESMPPSSVTLLVLKAKAHKKRILFALFVVLPILAGAIFVYWMRASARSATEDLAAAYDDATACLLGPALAKGERASLRVRSIQLGGGHRQEVAGAKSSWPHRCAPFFDKLAAAALLDSKTKKDVAPRAAKLADWLRTTKAVSEKGADFDAFFAAADEAALTAKSVTGAVLAPKPSEALDFDNVPGKARVSHKSLRSDQIRFSRAKGQRLFFVVDQDTTSRLCSVDARSERCEPIAGELGGKKDVRVVGSTGEGASPLLALAKGNDHVVHRSQGGFVHVATLPLRAAHTDKSGYLALVSAPLDARGRFEVHEQLEIGGPLKKTSFVSNHFGFGASTVHGVTIAAGQLVAAVRLSTGDVQLAFRPLPLTPGPFTLSLPVKLPNGAVPVAACGTGTQAAVRLGAQASAVAIYRSGAWTPLVMATAARGGRLEPGIDCAGEGAVIPQAPTGQIECSAANCKAVDGARFAVAPYEIRQEKRVSFGATVLAVALTANGGGVRYRLSAPAKLGRSGEDLLLFDGQVAEGKVLPKSRVEWIHVARAANGALVLLSTPKGVYAFRIMSDGKARPAAF
jgi:hypothetical protein